MNHRIFIAINFPEKIKKELLDCQKNIDNLFLSSQEDFGGKVVRWTKPESLHITLVFLSYLSDEEIMKVCNIVKEVAPRHSSFSVNLNKIYYGPPRKMPPRMIWVEGEKSKEFGLLRDDLENSLIGSGSVNYAPENRAFSPHITLGRIKTWEWKRIEPEERPEIEKEISLNFEAKSIEIMESRLKRGGAEYTVLNSFKLKED